MSEDTEQTTEAKDLRAFREWSGRVADMPDEMVKSLSTFKRFQIGQRLGELWEVAFEPPLLRLLDWLADRLKRFP